VHPYDKWVKFSEKTEETNVRRESMLKEIAEFLKKVLPTYALHQQDPYPSTASFVNIKDKDESEIEEEEAEHFSSNHYGVDPSLTKMRLLDTHVAGIVDVNAHFIIIYLFRREYSVARL